MPKPGRRKPKKKRKKATVYLARIRGSDSYLGESGFGTIAHAIKFDWRVPEYVFGPSVEIVPFRLIELTSAKRNAKRTR